jgi:DNA polymerase-4
MEDRRIILHIDMNSYFASVEQAADPFLRGKPVAVGGGISKRTVVATASYEARARGVKTAMSTWKALRICPELIVVEGDMAKYLYTTREIVKIFYQYTDLVEEFSIDEAFLDVTKTAARFGGAKELCLKIKGAIKKKFRITCSIGIAPNKLVAKVASGMEKPDGLTIVEERDIPLLFKNLPVKELCGIGDRTEEALNRMGIKTCGQLARYPLQNLIERFGLVQGVRLSNMGNGIDDSSVDPQKNKNDAKSISHSYTLPKNETNLSAVKNYLLQLCEQVGRRARKELYKGSIVSVYIRYGDFSGYCRQKNLKEYIDDGFEIYNRALKLILLPFQKPVRLIGISLSGFIKCVDQISLIEHSENKKKAIAAMDKINDKFGEFKITRASILHNKLREKCGWS